MANGSKPADTGTGRDDVSSTASLLGGDPDLYGEAAPEGLDLGDDFESTDDGGAPPADESGRAPQDEGGAGEVDDSNAEKTPGDDEGAGDEGGVADGHESEKDTGAEADAEGSKQGGKPEPKIPPWRLNQQAEKTRNYEAMLRANGIDPSTGKPFDKPAPQQQPEADTESDKPDPRIAEAEAAWDEYDAAAIDGDSEKMKAARSKARNLEREIEREQSQREAQKQTQQSTEEAAARARVEQAMPSILEQHPFLNDKSDDYSQEMLRETIQLRDLYLGQGMDVVDAINKAAHFVGTGYGYEPKPQPAAKPAERAAEKPAEGEAPATPERDANGRFKQSVDKKLEAANRQPPKASRSAARNDSELPKVSQMSEKQWDSLDDDARSDLLGDNV